MLRTELVARAKSALRVGTTYRLGAGAPPNSPTPTDSYGACDCSGFVLWSLGVSRYQPLFQFLYKELGHYWMNTDGMISDARNPTGLFSVADKALPGDILVYPSNYYARKLGWKGNGPRIGHTGIIVETVQTGTANQVIHCSVSNMKKFGDAVGITDFGPFAAVPYTKILRFVGVL